MKTAAQQMTAARKAIKAAISTNGKDTSYLHRVSIDTLTAAGMKECIVQEMAWQAVLDVVLCR